MDWETGLDKAHISRSTGVQGLDKHEPHLSNAGPAAWRGMSFLPQEGVNRGRGALAQDAAGVPALGRRGCLPALMGKTFWIGTLN